MKLFRIYEQGNKALINGFGWSVQEYIALSLFHIGFPFVGQYGKVHRQYLPAFTSHSVNKSTRLNRCFLDFGSNRLILTADVKYSSFPI